jgi:kynureninase
VQSATGHRFDIAAISGLARAAGAIVFIDGSQMVGAVPAPDDLRHVDVLVAPDHKFVGSAMNLSATASLRQLHQLARRDRQSGCPGRLRRLRARYHLRPQP